MPIREDLAALTVTVVDDEPSMRDILVRAAWSWGYACQSAGNAEEALPMLAECPTPLVVTDLRMPGNVFGPAPGSLSSPQAKTTMPPWSASMPAPIVICSSRCAWKNSAMPWRQPYGPCNWRRNASVIGGTSSTWCKRRRATYAIPSCRPSTAWCGRWKHATRTPRGTPCASAIWRCAWRRPSAWIALRAAS